MLETQYLFLLKRAKINWVSHADIAEESVTAMPSLGFLELLAWPLKILAINGDMSFHVVEFARRDLTWMIKKWQ